MEIRNLKGTSVEELVAVFNRSFSDYIVPFRLTVEQLKSKITAEDIKPELSLGVFESGKIVGFMLHGLRNNMAVPTVYNAGTGVIPEYRGKGLVGAMYEELLPHLQELHIKKMILEVIQENKPAVRAYEKIGYTVSRKLDCFSGKLNILKSSKEVTVQSVSEFQWDTFMSFWDILPSWQNTVHTIENCNNLCSTVVAHMDNVPVGYVIFNSESGKIHQFAVSADYRRMGIGSSLFEWINTARKGQEVYVYNIDHDSASSLGFLRKMGLSEKVVQFEMSKEI
ncbi:GNAT family N-acetyltransferase [Chryseobacterium soli]|uniref:GNAT family N-acetyltransferase n=1 Tax=Chryseobacterium soli TaxID=445961 RepID=UPI002953FDE4|nr:GNAT family N-acetyltransferase [Chryseobacterium soli]MDV7695798.1 GNAT family N-acetyltransferase [Chryseobacterium soli]